MDLADLRFNTDIRLTNQGWGPDRMGIGFWATTNYWGDLLERVCFHAHEPVADKTSTTNLIETMHKTADRVKNAVIEAKERFPDQIPCQLADRNPDGSIKIVVSEYSDRVARLHREERGYDRSSFAPHEPNNMPRPHGGGSYENAIASIMVNHLAGSEMHLEWSDYLNSYAEPIYLRDTRAPVWQYEARPRVISFDGKRVSAVVNQQRGTVCRRPDGLIAAYGSTNFVKGLAMDFRAARPGLPAGYTAWPPKETHSDIEML